MSGDALRGLDDTQREAAAALRGAVCVLAGAGTGKTRVITHRIAHGVDVGAYSPGHVMAVTFTAKAAAEMRGRLRALGVAGVAARTFHAAALAQVNFFWPQLAGDSAPAILDHKARTLAQVAESLRLRLDTAQLRDLASEIEWRKVTMRSLEAYARARPDGAAGLPVSTIVDLQRAYEKLKDDRRVMDFEDVLLACAGMIESEPRVAGAVREQYRHFTIDEYQDVSPVQDRLLSLWLGERRDLCVVGDPSQTIYSFAGADPSYLLGFERRYPDAAVVRLERNYRSTQEILAAANALMRGRPGALELRSAVGSEGPVPTVASYDDDAAEADGVATAIRSQLDAGADPRQIGVLYRFNAQSAPLLGALARRGIAASVLGGTRFFDLPEVRTAVMALRGAAVAAVHGSLADTVRDVLRSIGHADDPPPAGGAQRDSWEARASLQRLADEAPEGTTLREFADELLVRAKEHHDPGLKTVTLSTLHAAKGLEWEYVHLVGVSEGLLPIAYATTFEQIDEERRLAYVGITRARETLSVSYSRSSGPRERRVSRFVTEIGIGTLRPAVRRSPPGSATRS